MTINFNRLTDWLVAGMTAAVAFVIASPVRDSLTNVLKKE